MLIFVIFQVRGQRASNLVLLRRISTKDKTWIHAVIYGGILDPGQLIRGWVGLAHHSDPNRIRVTQVCVQLMEDLPSHLCFSIVRGGGVIAISTGESEILDNAWSNGGSHRDIQEDLPDQHRQR